MTLWATVERIIFEVCLTLCAGGYTVRKFCNKSGGILSLSLVLTLAFSPTHAVVLSNHRFRFPTLSHKVQGPARLVGPEQNLVGDSWLTTVL